MKSHSETHFENENMFLEKWKVSITLYWLYNRVVSPAEHASAGNAPTLDKQCIKAFQILKMKAHFEKEAHFENESSFWNQFWKWKYISGKVKGFHHLVPTLQ